MIKYTNMEKPILFSTPMVQAILEGRKTQTRRIMKPQPKDHSHEMYFEADWKDEKPEYVTSAGFNDGEYFCKYCGEGISLLGKSCYKSRYKKGDVLWVRETWQHTKCLNVNPEDENYGYVYKADNEPWEDFEGWQWKPSIFMPKEAARIFLKVTDVRVEKLQDISEEDAIAEGVELNQFGYYKDYSGEIDFIHARNSYMTLWESINGKGSWDKNPWVWVITFERIE